MKSKIQKLRVRLSVFFGIALVIFTCFTESAWDSGDYIFSTLLFFTGIVFVGIALLGRMWCSLYIASYKTKVLVTEGPYSITRNPLYFFSFIGFLGVGMCTETLLIPALLMIAFVMYYPLVISHEEAKLRQVHQAAYEKYIENTPRFFPDFTKLKEPDSYLVNPKIFRKHLIDAYMFVLIAGGIEVIEQLHKLGWITPVFRIY